MKDEDWRPVPPEALAAFLPGEPVVIRLEEWRKGRREIVYREGIFLNYSPGRGLVSVRFKEDSDAWLMHGSTTEFCDRTVGVYAFTPEEEMHTMTGWNE